jgi:hypothetical protein
MYEQSFLNACEFMITVQVSTDGATLLAFVPPRGRAGVECDSIAGCHSIAGFVEECHDGLASRETSSRENTSHTGASEQVTPEDLDSSKVPPIDAGTSEIDRLLHDLQNSGKQKQGNDQTLRQMDQETDADAARARAADHERETNLERREINRQEKETRRLEEQNRQLHERQMFVQRQIEADKAREIENENLNQLLNSLGAIIGGAAINRSNSLRRMLSPRRNSPYRGGTRSSSCGVGQSTGVVHACK